MAFDRLHDEEGKLSQHDGSNPIDTEEKKLHPARFFFYLGGFLGEKNHSSHPRSLVSLHDNTNILNSSLA